MRTKWLIEASSGNLEAIPDGLQWANGGRTISGLVNGYELARHSAIFTGKNIAKDKLILASGSVNEFVREKIHRGQLDISAIDLLVAMFFEQRRERFTISIVGNDKNHSAELHLLDTMSALLRSRLLKASEEELKIIKKELNVRKKI